MGIPCKRATGWTIRQMDAFINKYGILSTKGRKNKSQIFTELMQGAKARGILKVCGLYLLFDWIPISDV